MRIGYVMVSNRGDTNRVLTAVAAQLRAEGLCLAGAVQSDTDCAPGGKCDMDLEILPAGPVVRISQSLGAQSRGCRLDPVALEQAVGLTEARLNDATPDIVILNKFGKHEAEGRGFRSTVARALEADLPILVGVNATNMAAFEAFTGGLAEVAGDSVETVLTWLNRG